MGICLDTDKNKDESDEIEETGGGAWTSQTSRNFGYSKTPPEGKFFMQNDVPVNFEKPKVPVIFLLGGPGSGKVTHCDNLSEEKRGVIHINMSDLLQQYTTGNGTKNYNELSSKTVTEVLMLEIKMSPAAKTFLISGYPRNMRDVVEYYEKIHTVSGVILLAWRQSMLERQVEYGAKLGHVILHFARMELTNFFQSVTPVAEYFDQRGMLIVINGERNPAEVYNDFRAAVLRILSTQNTVDAEEQKERKVVSIPNGEVIRPMEALPAGLIKVTPVIKMENITPDSVASPTIVSKNMDAIHLARNETTPVQNMITIPEASVITAPVSVHNPASDQYPDVIYVVGGPGSDKAHICEKVLQRVPDWSHISIGLLLRAKVSSRDLQLDDAQAIKDSITAGELVDGKIVNDMLHKAMLGNANSSGIVLDGYPRNLDQLHEFEEEYQQHPHLILLDCSKLQLGRGRWDDSVSAFRKRLEVFREHTLPMLKVLDTEHRLTMVDGDTSTPEVQEEFTIALINTIQQIQSKAVDGRDRRSSNIGAAAILQDLEDEATNMVTEIRKSSIQMNGFGPPRDRSHPSSSYLKRANVVSVTHTGGQTGVPYTENIFKTNAQVESYPEDKNN